MRDIASGNFSHSYGKWQLKSWDLPIKMVDFSSSLCDSHSQRVPQLFMATATCWEIPILSHPFPSFDRGGATQVED